MPPEKEKGLTAYYLIYARRQRRQEPEMDSLLPPFIWLYQGMPIKLNPWNRKDYANLPYDRLG